MVHGLWNTAAIFVRLRAYLESRGWPVYALNMTPSNGDVGIEVLAQQVAAFAQVHLNQPFDLVGFSMGGLVCRYYVQRLRAGQVQRLVTVSAPHHGSALALFRFNPGGRQMRPGSRFLRDLNRDLSVLTQLQFVSIWTPFDALVVPAWSSRLPVGQEQIVPVWSHNRMVWDQRGMGAIAAALS
ncbi:lipase family alpha/beta hydrolase [Vasconcelosia minhoensis]|uniref:lipase family alpha/beta hydrolase n=1 Tax=Vasconcelosia minhoensis TaxID=3366354 RepID=UPI001D146E64